MFGAWWSGKVAGYGQKELWEQVRLSIFPYRLAAMLRENKMNTLKPILLIEDCSKDVELTLAALEDCHVANQVIVLRDGNEAIQYLRKHAGIGGDCSPAVILLDIKMPKLSGIEVLRAIKAEPQLKGLPVVMLTSSCEGPDIAQCYQLGANAYVVKPVECAKFFEMVKDVGRFWAVVNQLPERKKIEEDSREASASGRA
jgi:CheY-like chemotaxis protein